MPLLSTRGGLSSRGFGQLNGGAGLTLNTFTFPAGSSTFTVPATTNSLISAVGAGADGTPGGQVAVGISQNILTLRRRSTSFAGGLSDTYESYLNTLNTTVNLFNQGGTVYFTINQIEVGPNNLTDYPFNQNRVASDVIAGSASAVLINNPPTSGPVTFASVTNTFVWRAGYQVRESVSPTTGANTTGFGLLFPGGAGGPSTTTTINNVAVVPNQTYVINNNKSLTITYLA
jgi:hypothetical protein